MVAAARRVLRHEQQWHLGGEYQPPNQLAGPWDEQAVLVRDVNALVQAELLDAVNLNYVWGNEYVITAKGYAYYAVVKQRAGGPLERQEAKARALLASEEFREAFPTAYAKWADAEALLWKATSDRELSTIGHKAREAVQDFANALVEENELPNARARLP
jgi:hypothetical protein